MPALNVRTPLSAFKLSVSACVPFRNRLFIGSSQTGTEVPDPGSAGPETRPVSSSLMGEGGVRTSKDHLRWGLK